MSNICKYYRSTPTEVYTTECCGDSNSVHPADIEGAYCQLCGGEINFQEYTEVPSYLLDV